MARLRTTAVPRHRPPGADWWLLELPQLEGLVERRDHIAAYRLGREMRKALDERRGCGQRSRPSSIAPCEACEAIDRATERVMQLELSARLNAPMGWIPPV